MNCNSSAPAEALATLCILLFLPSHFPYRKTEPRPRFWKTFTWKSAQKLDFTGALLSLAAVIVLVVALEEGGSRLHQNSAVMIATFASS